MKCPVCESKFDRKNICTNADCELSYVLPKERRHVRWQYVLTRAFSLKWWYRFIKRITIDRYDLVRTGLKPFGYYDVDVRLECSMMNLLVEFVEQELPFEIVDMDWHTMPDGTRTVGDEIRELYTMIKVRLPKLEREQNEALDLWARGKTLVCIPAKEDIPEDIQEARWKALQQYDEDVENMYTDILTRIVIIRGYLWT